MTKNAIPNKMKMKNDMHEMESYLNDIFQRLSIRMTDKIIIIALNISKTEGCQNCTVWIAKKSILQSIIL